MPVIIEVIGADVLKHIQQGTEELQFQVRMGVDEFGKIMETEHRREISRVFVDDKRALLETKWIKSRDGGYLKTSEGAYRQDSSKDHWVRITDKNRRVHNWALRYGASYIKDIAEGRGPFLPSGKRKRSIRMHMRRGWSDAPFSRGLYVFDELMKKRVNQAFRKV